MKSKKKSKKHDHGVIRTQQSKRKRIQELQSRNDVEITDAGKVEPL